MATQRPRCPDCPRAATHGVYRWIKDQRWHTAAPATKRGRQYAVEATHCTWHATVQAVIRNHAATRVATTQED